MKGWPCVAVLWLPHLWALCWATQESFPARTQWCTALSISICCHWLFQCCCSQLIFGKLLQARIAAPAVWSFHSVMAKWGTMCIAARINAIKQALHLPHSQVQVSFVVRHEQFAEVKQHSELQEDAIWHGTDVAHLPSWLSCYSCGHPYSIQALTAI